MTKVICCSEQQLPDRFAPGTLYLSMFSSPKREGVGHVALELPKDIRRDNIAPSVIAWDFATIALSVATTDKAILRSETADGWTRTIDLSVSLVEPDIWNAKRIELESMLRFLSGDFWKLNFTEGGVEPPKAREPQERDADCICLLSGGIDSLVGAIDLTALGKKPLFVSQVVRGNSNAQAKFASSLDASNRHCQWSFSAKHPGPAELSTRARSIVFFAFAALAASAVSSSNQRPVNIIVPENGFISLNVPLSPGRLGSLSTKTTHPVYMAAVQSLWDTVGIDARLSFPYRDKTKGELLINCANLDKLISMIADSTSCGKYQRHKLTHCGECVPCLVRRAAFFKAGLQDTTIRGYLCEELARSESKDVAATAAAYVRYQDEGIRRFTGAALSFAPYAERLQYEDVISRGMEELGQFLASQGLI